MALWGISTTTETAANNYAIPKYTSGSVQFTGVDINNTPHNMFADYRGWIYRHYQDNKYSGLSTQFYDEVHVPVAGLNTNSTAANETGLSLATPAAVFFKEPNTANPISIVGGGATNFISTATSGEVHLCFNETVYAGAGATVRIRTFDANNENESTAIVATASSVSPSAEIPTYTNQGLSLISGFNGQVTNRVAFTFTAPSTVLTADVNFVTTTVSTGQTVAIGATIIAVNSLVQTTADLPGVDLKRVSIGDSITAGGVSLGQIISVGTTSVTISTGQTSATEIAAGTAVTFSRRTSQTNLMVDMASGFIGVITDMYDGSGVTSSFTSDIIRQVGGAGTISNTTSDTYPLGVGTTILSVKA